MFSNSTKMSLLKNSDLRFVLSQFNRDILRQLARNSDIKRGKNKSDTIKNLVNNKGN